MSVSSRWLTAIFFTIWISLHFRAETWWEERQRLTKEHCLIWHKILGANYETSVKVQEYVGFLFLFTGICKVHINQTSGVITTPNYPDNYPNYMDCLWTIQLHPAMLIPLVCDEIAIEKEEGCPYDYMEILEGDGLHSTVIERHCGVLNRSLTIERNGSLSIRFVSDQDKENKGFRCSYDILRG